jgi:MFS family permease
MRFWTAIGLILVLSATGLTYEIAAGRVLAPFFGTSLLTWTTVIAVVLAGFSLGNAVGGLIAERERGKALASVRAALVVTAVLAALSPSILALIYAWGARGTGGMLLAVVIAFFPASVLISAPSPLLARLAVEARPGREGSSLGLVLAAGSLGAILGAVLTGFVALPLVGSAATFAGCAALVLLCVPFLRDRDTGGTGGGGGPASLAPLLPVGLLVAATAALGPVCRFESGLSCIDVTRSGGAVHLLSDRTRQAAERLAANPASDRQPPSRAVPC